MTRFRAQVKRIFDKSKVTVVGSPTITSDGVASGFTTANYIKTSIIIPANSEIKVTGRFTMPKSTFGDRAEIFHYGDLISNRIWLQIEYGDKLQLAGGDGSKRATSTNKLDFGATYDYECIFNGSNLLTLKFKKIEDKDFTIVTANQTATIGNANLTDLYFGIYSNQNLPFKAGSIDLTAFKIYVNGELVYSPTKPKTFLEKRKLKKKWFTIIGNPTITANKLASGFSNKNYIETFNSSLLANPFELYFGFTATNVNDRQTVFGMQTGYGFNIALQSGKMMFGASSNGASLDIAGNLTSSLTINANTKYLGRLKWTGTVYTLSLYINNAWVDYITVNNSNAILGGKTVNVGLINNVYPYVNGSIDLKDIKLVVNSIPVFDGSVETYVYDPSKFTVVGSPTITEDGVASGFWYPNYLKTGINLSDYNNWKITMPFIYNSKKNDWSKLLGTLSDVLSVFNISSENSFALALKDANGDRINPSERPALLCFTGDNILLELEFTGTKYIFKLTNETRNTSLLKEYISSVKIGSDELLIGYGTSTSFDSSMHEIDLKQFSITVNGKEIFTGAKEQFYAMRGM